MPDHLSQASSPPRRPHTGRHRNEAARQAVLEAAAELLWYRILIGHAPLAADVAAQLTRALIR